MHCRELVELAAVVAVEGAVRTEGGRAAEAAIQHYWSACKIRFENWSRALQAYLRLQITTPPHMTSTGILLPAWQQLRPVVEEILVAEILTRIWAGATSGSAGGVENALAPVARNVYARHLEARNRALNVLVYGRGIGPRDASNLNSLRRRCERWTDLLLSYLVDVPPAAPHCNVGVYAFAFEPERTCEFARDMADERTAATLTDELLRSSLRTAFATGLSDDAPQAELNEQIAASISGCLQSLKGGSNQSSGCWLERMTQMTSDAEAMVEDLLALEGPPTINSR